VAGTIEYLIFTRFIPRPGWLIYSFFITLISLKNKKLFNRKDLKSFISFLRNRSTSVEVALWNILKLKQLDGKKSEDNTVLLITLLISVVLQKNF
jgi:hypothetical protein